MITVGDKIRDNDPRVGRERVLNVCEVCVYDEDGPNYVSVIEPRSRPPYKARQLRIRMDRIFADGKPRTRGFTLLNVLRITRQTSESTRTVWDFRRDPKRGWYLYAKELHRWEAGFPRGEPFPFRWASAPDKDIPSDVQEEFLEKRNGVAR